MITRTEKNKSKRKEITKKENQEKRNKILGNTFKVLTCIIIVISVSYVILRYVGNYGLVVKEESLVYENLPENFHGLKIVQFSDLHYGTTVDTKKLESIVNKINSINPDIIIFTGDLIDQFYSIKKEEIEDITLLLNKLEAKLGKYTVEGNHDKKYFNTIIENTDFIYLENSSLFTANACPASTLVLSAASITKLSNLLISSFSKPHAFVIAFDFKELLHTSSAKS